MSDAKYITKSDAHFKYRVAWGVVSKLITEGKLALHLHEGRIMLDAEETDRVLRAYKKKSRNRCYAHPAIEEPPSSVTEEPASSAPNRARIDLFS